MSRQSSATAARQNVETVIEVCRQLANSEDANSCRCQFQRQRNAVEPATYLKNSRHVGIREGEAIRGRHCALVKQLDTRIAKRISSGEIDRI